MCNWKLLLNKGIAFHNNSSAEYTTFIKLFKQMCWVKFFKPIQSLVQSMCLLLHCVQISGFWLLSSHVQNTTHSHNCTRQSGVKWFQHRLVSRLHSAKMGKQDTSSPLPQSRQNYDISFSSLPAGICQFLHICCFGLSVWKDGGGGTLITRRLKSSIIRHRKRFMLIGQLPGLFIKVITYRR